MVRWLIAGVIAVAVVVALVVGERTGCVRAPESVGGGDWAVGPVCRR